MGKVLAVTNQKGGVGKTTTCVNLGTSLAVLKKKVLLIDFDPQGNTSSGLGFASKNSQNTIYSVISGQIDLVEAISKTEIGNLDIVQTDIHLSGAEIELVDQEQREYVLKNKIIPAKNDYDYIFIDCPPSLGLLTINSLVAAESILIPLQCEYYAMEGMSQLLNTVEEIRKTCNQNLTIEGILPTMYDQRNNISKQVVDDLRNYFQNYIFDTIIPRNVKLSEAPSFGQPAYIYDQHSSGSQSYLALARELIQKNLV